MRVCYHLDPYKIGQILLADSGIYFCWVAVTARLGTRTKRHAELALPMFRHTSG